MSIAVQAGKATLWNLLGNGSQQIAGLLLFLYLARVLKPEDFGIVAVAFVIVETITLIGRLGILEVIQQRQDVDDKVRSTAFWVLASSGAILTLAIIAVAPLVEQIFSYQNLGQVLMLCAPICIVQNLGGVHEAMIRRSFGFKWLAARTMVATLGGSLVAAGMAYAGYGLYALVGQRLVTVCLITVMVWQSYRWIPSFSFSRSEASSILKFGIHIATAGFMSFINPRILDIVVGYTLGATALGTLRVASRIFDFVAQVAIVPVLNVAFVSFSRLQNDHVEVNRMFLRVIQISTLVLLPTFLGLALVSDDLVPWLFGEQWRNVATPFKLLAILSFVAPLNYFFAPVMVALGKSSTIMYQAWLQIILTLVLAGMAVPFGLIAVICSHVFRAYLVSGINMYLLRKHVGLNIPAFFKTILPLVASAAVMVVCVLVAQHFQPADLVGFPAILLSAAVGAVAYVAALLAGDFLKLWPHYLRDIKLAAQSTFRRGGDTSPAIAQD